MAANTPTTDASGGGKSWMDKWLREAATNGHYWPLESGVSSIEDWAQENPSILHGTTPQGNNCLHISTIHGHKDFCMRVLKLELSHFSNSSERSLLSKVNCEHETPLVIAVTLGHAQLALDFLKICCEDPVLKPTILQPDRYGFNALHHAIRNGHEDLALELILKEPALSQAVTKYNESPMFMAVMRNFTRLSLKLLSTNGSSHAGQYGRNALHASARNGNHDIARQIMEERHALATEDDWDGITPLRMAISCNKVDVLQVLLEHRPSLAYETDKDGYSLLCSAATRGQVDVARALLNACPDAFYSQVIGPGPVIEKSLEIGDKPVIENSHVTGDSPVTGEGPLIGEIPITQNSLVIEESHVKVKRPVIGDIPVTRESTIIGVGTVLEEREVIGDNPVSGESPIIKEIPIIRDILVSGESPMIREGHVIGEGPVIGKNLVTGESHVIGENSVTGEGPVMGESEIIGDNLVIEESPVIEENQIIGDIPLTAESSVAGENSIIEEGHVIAEGLIIAESPVIGETPVIGECPVIGDPPIIGESPEIENSPVIGESQVIEKILVTGNCPVTEKSPIIGHRLVIANTLTCLHIAVSNGHLEFVEFILRTRQLQKLINRQDNDGRTALHYAVQKCDPRLVATLLSHKTIDTTILDNRGNSAASQLSITIDDKTLDWKEVHTLMLKADPKDDEICLYNLSKGAKQRETIESRMQGKAITQKYTSNTSLLAILLATITFTAAFTLPGGYNSDSENAGLPIMSGKITFKAFLLFDTLAMCSSFIVAFICLMGKWEHDRFTTYYISVTKKLTWFAYLATIMAFSTGLYTVLASHHRYLAIAICSLVALFFILTFFIANWPYLKLGIRLGQTLHDLELKFLQWFDLQF